MNLIQLVLLGDQPIFLAKTCHINIVTMIYVEYFL